MKWVIDRIKERSTWLGLVSIATAVGVSLSPDQGEAIVAAGLAAGGLVAAFTGDKTGA